MFLSYQGGSPICIVFDRSVQLPPSQWGGTFIPNTLADMLGPHFSAWGTCFFPCQAQHWGSGLPWCSLGDIGHDGCQTTGFLATC